MILVLTIVQIALAVAVGLFCVIRGLIGRVPDDLALGGLALVELLLLAQIVVAALGPAVGNLPTGNPGEFWLYLITAALIPFLAGIWALSDRSRWSTVVLGVAALAIAVMLYRMHVIWTVQVA